MPDGPYSELHASCVLRWHPDLRLPHISVHIHSIPYSMHVYTCRQVCLLACVYSNTLHSHCESHTYVHRCTCMYVPCTHWNNTVNILHRAKYTYTFQSAGTIHRACMRARIDACVHGSTACGSGPCQGIPDHEPCLPHARQPHPYTHRHVNLQIHGQCAPEDIGRQRSDLIVVEIPAQAQAQ
jgi:hypothetical protein